MPERWHWLRTVRSLAAQQTADLLCDVLFKAGVIESGEKGETIFTAPAPGIYTAICTVAGHFPAMQGKLVVE